MQGRFSDSELIPTLMLSCWGGGGGGGGACVHSSMAAKQCHTQQIGTCMCASHHE